MVKTGVANGGISHLGIEIQPAAGGCSGEWNSFQRCSISICWLCAANKAVAEAVFGVWENGTCVEHRHRKDSTIERVTSKEDCWARAFNNPGVASDHPVTDSENIGTWGYYFPSVGPNQPKSGE